MKGAVCCLPSFRQAFRALDRRGTTNSSYLVVTAAVGLVASGGFASFDVAFDRTVLTGSSSEAASTKVHPAHPSSLAPPQRPQIASSSNAATGASETSASGTDPESDWTTPRFDLSRLLDARTPADFPWLWSSPPNAANGIQFSLLLKAANASPTPSVEDRGAYASANEGSGIASTGWGALFANFRVHVRQDDALAFPDLSTDQLALQRGRLGQQMDRLTGQMTRHLNDVELPSNRDPRLNRVLTAAVRDVLDGIEDGRLSSSEQGAVADLADTLSMLGDDTLTTLLAELEQIKRDDALLANEQNTRDAIQQRMANLDDRSDWNKLSDTFRASVEQLRALDESARKPDAELSELSGRELLNARERAQLRLSEIARSEGELDQPTLDEVGRLLALDRAMQQEQLARDYETVAPRFKVNDTFAKRLHDPLEARLVEQGVQYLDELYAMGGKVPGGTNSSGEPGIDCSGFTRLVYQNAEGVGIDIREGTVNQDDLPRVADADKRPGDLLFGDGSRGSTGHVGIYLGYFDVRPYVDLEARPDLAQFDGSVEIYMHSSTRIDSSGKEGVQFTALDDWSGYNEYVTRPDGLDSGASFDADAYQVSSTDVVTFAASA